MRKWRKTTRGNKPSVYPMSKDYRKELKENAELYIWVAKLRLALILTHQNDQKTLVYDKNSINWYMLVKHGGP